MAKEQCISCGHDDVPLFPIEGAFMPEQYRVCGNCKSKYQGGERDGSKLRSPTNIDLAQEADRIMTGPSLPDVYYCYSCRNPVVMLQDGNVPMYCSSCMNAIFHVCRSLSK